MINKPCWRTWRATRRHPCASMGDGHRCGLHLGHHGPHWCDDCDADREQDSTDADRLADLLVSAGIVAARVDEDDAS
jgi:hypothetical protein